MTDEIKMDTSVPLLHIDVLDVLPAGLSLAMTEMVKQGKLTEEDVAAVFTRAEEFATALLQGDVIEPYTPAHPDTMVIIPAKVARPLVDDKSDNLIIGD